MKITINEIEYYYDEKLSLKDFTGRGFTDEEKKAFESKVIYASCFSQQVPDTDIFGNLIGATFIDCNLDNVKIPEFCLTVFDNGVLPRRILPQKDGNDWIVDEGNEPIKPTNHNIFEKLKLDLPDPKNIPTEKVTVPVDLVKVAQIDRLLSANDEIN